MSILIGSVLGVASLEKDKDEIFASYPIGIKKNRNGKTVGSESTVASCFIFGGSQNNISKINTNNRLELDEETTKHAIPTEEGKNIVYFD
jgi:hypothetical protein